ncbi:NACHT domain-containing protein [Streptomyces microflavus]|uniref:NACHT domain-containing protein n=1 Tax=Streptomyces microflavus TaxID=1919 RepID=UPI00365EFB4E
MPLNWEQFAALPGSPTDNFELLCRGAVTHAYARYGRFVAQAQQPGVEFHLEIDQPNCPLGEPGRCFGWQTKWWDIPSGTAIGRNRRRDVEDSIAKTETHFPAITDFILWTRRHLTAGDQAWYRGLASRMRLHLATEVELAHLLIGDAVLLREAYFGSLVLTPERLASQHERAAAEAGERWVPTLHQTSAAEQQVRRMLAEREAWEGHLSSATNAIARFQAALVDPSPPLPDPIAEQTAEIMATAGALADLLGRANDQIQQLLSAEKDAVPAPPPVQPDVLRKLRALRHAASLPLTNLIAHARDAEKLARTITRDLSTRLVVITGDAGFGKTQTAATLTASTQTRPAGVLLYGRRLTARGTLDDLAGQFSVAGRPLTSFEELLTAVDAAAKRAGCRLPIVIDGLNEAESASVWPPLLRSLHRTLRQFPSVLVVCTVREAFLDNAVPEEADTVLELDGFDQDLDKAIARYFNHYKIDPGEEDLPRELLNHPLSLKIFCTVANPDRALSVSAAGMPTSLTGMFSAFISSAAQRVNQLNPSIHPNDVDEALDALGWALWEERTRNLTERRAKELCRDAGRRWQESLLTALEHEGILLRQPDGAGATAVSFVYDLLAGHITAASLIRTHGTSLGRALSQDTTTLLFKGTVRERHPLSADIFRALASALPRVGKRHLWQVVGEPLRLEALLQAARLETAYLDSTTVEEIAAHIDELRGHDDILGRLYSARAIPGHPLNAMFLDRILRDRPVAERDLRWSEWLRRHQRQHVADAASLIEQWREGTHRGNADQLRARWMMWTLTSSNRHLRDAATAALYWYGRHDLAGLFALAEESVAINDAYISERMTAVAYGAATAQQLHPDVLTTALSRYLRVLLRSYTGSDAAHPTHHALTRYYVASTFEFAQRYCPGALPADANMPLLFAPGPAVTALSEGDQRHGDVRPTLRMDFENYTLGRLIPDRRNYDNSHTGHQEATGIVLAVVHSLGWRPESFADVDADIAADGYRRSDSATHQIERYGKKYGWIGYHTVAGLRADLGLPAERLESNVDIDPTFPQPTKSAPLQLETWSRRSPADDLSWLRHGPVTVPGDLLAPARLGTDEGPWILVHADVEAKDTATGRSVFGLFNTVLIDKDHVTEIVEEFNALPHPGRDMIDLPAEYYVFAGEFPWHTRFAVPEPGQTLQDLYSSELRYDRPDLRFERLAHRFAWEPHNSPQNQATAYTPSRLFSQAFDLRVLPGSFDQAEPSGALATRSLTAPAGFTGEMVYLRADLLHRYASGGALITFCWGERQLLSAWPERPAGALSDLYQAYENIWRQVKQHQPPV